MDEKHQTAKFIVSKEFLSTVSSSVTSFEKEARETFIKMMADYELMLIKASFVTGKPVEELLAIANEVPEKISGQITWLRIVTDFYLKHSRLPKNEDETILDHLGMLK